MWRPREQSLIKTLPAKEKCRVIVLQMKKRRYSITCMCAGSASVCSPWPPGGLQTPTFCYVCLEFDSKWLRWQELNLCAGWKFGEETPGPSDLR